MKRVFLIVSFASIVVAGAAAADWPQWRGPHRDGTGAVFNEPSKWPDRLIQRWSISVGTGHASPVLVGTRLYLHSRQAENEVVSAIDAATGNVLWTDRYPAPYTMNPAATAHGPGPKSTPAVAGGRVFTLGITGILSALDAGGGKVLWRKAAPPEPPTFGTAMSPVVDGNLVIAHVGGAQGGALTAFDAATGVDKWKWTGDGPGYASPVVVTFGGTKQVVTQTQSRIVGVSASSGQLLWEIPLKTPYEQNSVTPLVYRDTIIYGGLGNPSVAVRPVERGGGWSLERLWDTPESGVYMSTPVVAGDAVYGMSNLEKGHFFALDARTGKTLWATRGRTAENAAIIRAGNLLFLLKDDAELVVAKASPASFEVVRRYTVADSATWAHPVIDGDRIFVKDVNTLRAWALQ